MRIVVAQLYRGPLFNVSLRKGLIMKFKIVYSALAGVASSLALAATSVAAPTLSVGYGDTSVKLDPIFVGALQSLSVTPSAIGSSRIVNGVAFFPVIDGDFDFGTAKGEISHRGGLALKAGNTIVELADFLIDSSGEAPVLTGKVIVNDSFVGRITLFDLTLPALTLPLQAPRGWGQLRVPGVKVALNAGAAEALNSVFNVTAFAGGIPIGEATVKTFAFGH
jgi:hypothetical protein